MRNNITSRQLDFLATVLVTIAASITVFSFLEAFV